MSTAVLLKLLAIVAIAALGWVAGRLRWLGNPATGTDPARVLSAAALYLFVPPLLFRTTARIDLRTLPWGTLAGFFGPVLVVMLVLYALQRSRAARGALAPAAPATRAVTAGFGNTVQIGIPVAAALFGESGLAIHLTVVSVHALTLLSVFTALAELDLARARRETGGSNAHLGRTLARTARQTLVHPVVMPVLLGLVWNLAGLPLPRFADELMQTLGMAVVPVCLVLIGLSLATYGVQGAVRPALALAAVKLLLVPAAVLGFAHGVLGLGGLPLAVLVMAAALPSGSNALIFAQRYEVQVAESSAAIVFSTVAFAITAPLWLWAATAVGR